MLVRRGKEKQKESLNFLFRNFCAYGKPNIEWIEILDYT